MRIAFVSANYRPSFGGVETHVEQLATRMVALGHEVEVWTHAIPPASAGPEELEGVTVRRFSLFARHSELGFSLALTRHLATRSRDFDIVHAHGYATLPALQAALGPARAFVFTPHYHGTSHHPIRRLLHSPYRLLGAGVFRRAAAVICVAPGEAALVTRRVPEVAKRIVIIPNGVDVAAIRAAPPYPRDDEVVVAGGRLESYKNVDRVIAALPYLPERMSLCITGDGPDRRRLGEVAVDVGESQRVHFLGRVSTPSLRSWLRTASVYVTMSALEANPITVLESLAAGTPVVASDIAAHRDIADAIGPQFIRIVPAQLEARALAAAISGAWPTDVAVSAGSGAILEWDDVVDRTLAVYRAAIRRTTRIPADRPCQSPHSGCASERSDPRPAPSG